MEEIKISGGTREEVLEKVRSELGPDAVIRQLRKTSGNGVRFWATGYEVIASRPAITIPEPDLQARLNRRVAQLSRRSMEPDGEPLAKTILPAGLAARFAQGQQRPGEETIAAARLLEKLGILPSHARWISGHSSSFPGHTKPRDLAEEMQIVRESLADYWHSLARRVERTEVGTRVLIGAPGSGKTTALCKWMTDEVFIRRRPSRAWRLDGHLPNTARMLDLQCELLGVRVDRVWGKIDGDDDSLRFVDLPGVQTDDPAALTALIAQVRQFPKPQTYLVLNMAYDLGLLLAQAKFFSKLPLSGLIITHVDEEKRWSKCWNLVLATQLPVAYIAGGQQIPGEFRHAAPEALFDALLASEQDLLD